MGFIRGGLLVIASVLFFIGLLAGGFFYTLNTSLNYENVKIQIYDLANKTLSEKLNTAQILGEDLNRLKLYCKQNNSSYVANQSEMNIKTNISCESISQGKEAIIQEFLNESVEQIYYAEYDCTILKCLEDKDKYFFFVSQQFKEEIANKLYITYICLAILLILILILTKKKHNAFFIIGALFVIASLPFLKLESLFSFLGESALSVINIFFSKSYTAFIRMIIIGVSILIVGFLFRFFELGFKISNMIEKIKSKDSASKEETSSKVSQSKKEDKKPEKQEQKQTSNKQKETKKKN